MAHAIQDQKDGRKQEARSVDRPNHEMPPENAHGDTIDEGFKKLEDTVPSPYPRFSVEGRRHPNGDKANNLPAKCIDEELQTTHDKVEFDR